MKSESLIVMLTNLKLEKRDIGKRLAALWSDIEAVCNAFEDKRKGRLGTGWTAEQMVKNGFKVEGITLTHFRLMWKHWHAMNAYAVSIDKRIDHLRLLMKRQRSKK